MNRDKEPISPDGDKTVICLKDNTDVCINIEKLNNLGKLLKTNQLKKIEDFNGAIAFKSKDGEIPSAYREKIQEYSYLGQNSDHVTTVVTAEVFRNPNLPNIVKVTFEKKKKEDPDRIIFMLDSDPTYEALKPFKSKWRENYWF